MNSSKRKYHSQIEITDLMVEAVFNAAKVVTSPRWGNYSFPTNSPWGKKPKR
jgi:hypothetical protein